MAGTFDSFNLTRKTLVENMDELINYQELTKDLEPEFVLKPEIIEYGEYTNEEIINIEKDLFGFYLSNHPVTNYKAKYKNIISLESVPSNFNKIIECVVLVERVKKITTKKGEEMEFIEASDEYLKRDFTLFPKVFKLYNDLKVGNIIKVKGRVEKRYDNYQIIVEELEKLN